MSSSPKIASIIDLNKRLKDQKMQIQSADIPNATCTVENCRRHANHVITPTKDNETKLPTCLLHVSEVANLLFPLLLMAEGAETQSDTEIRFLLPDGTWSNWQKPTK